MESIPRRLRKGSLDANNNQNHLLGGFKVNVPICASSTKSNKSPAAWELCNHRLHTTTRHIPAGTALQRGRSTAEKPAAERVREIINADYVLFATRRDLAEKGERVDQ